MPTFTRWGQAHLMAIVLTLIVPLLLAVWMRYDRSGRVGRWSAAGFATILLGTIGVMFVWLDRGAAPRWQDMMPLHLCDLALFACAAACLTRHRFAYEIAYFWGLAGTLQGLITPDLDAGFPAAQFWFFFLGHGGIVGSVLFLTAGFGMRPRWSSLVRAYVTILAFAVVVGGFNAAFDTNYAYLCAKPGVPSLLDWLGPWPWYIGSLALVALANFTLLYTPWVIVDRLRARTAPWPDAPRAI